MERVTVDLISTKEFPRVNKGYDPKEVGEKREQGPERAADKRKEHTSWRESQWI